MRKLFQTLFCLSLFFIGCQQAELVAPNEGGQPMKAVTISAGMSAADTKASLDSETGAFTWQSGDIISVLATDGMFYDFVLVSGAGEKIAEFEGSIPETAEITTVATYPVLVASGTENTILTSNTLNYVLPETWNYVAEVSNVPMVAAFGEGATEMSFKQVGGVMRFPVTNLPKEAVFVVTMNDKVVTGSFPVDVTALGESAMTAEEGTSVVTINYAGETDGESAEFSVPVPIGVYNNFNVTIKDSEGNELLTKDYDKDNIVNRATLLMMKELAIPERPMVIDEVWPFYVDARVVFAKNESITQYAAYVDGAEEPLILDAEDWGENSAILVGGEFAHNTTHTVAVAKVVDGNVVPESKSETVEFTTGRVMQMTYNTGTKFVCAAWDDVAIGIENSTVYNEATKKWSMVAKTSASERDKRGYRVQLYAEDKTTLLYDEIPFSSQVDFGGGISNSSWIGKIDGANVLLPTSLTFGWLEPGKTYYFRVQTLAEPVTFTEDNEEFRSYKADASYTVSSTRGGCGWSELTPMTTDAPHVPSANEVFFEGFDDMMHNSDIMNMSVAAVPEFVTSASEAGNYKKINSAALYRAWADKMATTPLKDMKFSEQGFNTMLGVFYHGMTDDNTTTKNTPSYLNKYAGSLEGWSVVIGTDKKPTRTMNPNFGSVRLGESGTASGKTELRTAPIMSDKLSENVATPCVVTVKVSAHSTTEQNINVVLGVYHYRGDQTLDNKNTIQFNLDENGNVRSDWSANYTWTDASNYIHYPTWFEVKTTMNLMKGDVIGFEKANPKVDGVSDFYGGCVTIGEVTIEIDPTVNEFADDGVGTEPDDTNYDVYGLGEFPISYWYTVEPSAYTKVDESTGVPYYDYELTKARYQEVKDAGINIALYYGHAIDRSITENKRIHDICAEVGLKFIGNVWAENDAARIQLIKDNFENSNTYVGELLRDEPSIDEFDGLASFVDAYNAALPNKEVYINLFPEYANAATQLGGSYEYYINQYLTKIKTKSLSFDYYGLHKTNLLFNEFYSNLDIVRSKTLDQRMPFWVITQGGMAGSAKMPTEDEQRWSVWANIAVGSKGISYFCYWTPSGGNYDDKGFPISINGEKQDTYTWIQKINKDINTIGKKLLHCHADGAILGSTKYYPLYDNNGAGRSKYGPISNVTGSTTHLVGCFRDARRSENGDNYKGYKALVLSQMPTRDIEVTMSIANSVSAITFTHNNTSSTLELTNTLSTTVGGISVAFDGAQLILGIPKGEAVLLEF